MNPLWTHAHHYHHHAISWGGWMAHMVISSIVHSVIWSFLFKLMRQLSLLEAGALVVAVLALLFGWARARDRHGW